MKNKIIDWFFELPVAKDIEIGYYGTRKRPITFAYKHYGGFCTLHFCKLVPNYEWYYWECPKCRRSSYND